MNISDLRQFKNIDGFHEIDLQFADFIIKTAKTNDIYLYLASALASHSIRNGHICCELKDIAGTEFPVYRSGIELTHSVLKLPTISLPNFNLWYESLLKFPDIISENNYTPLILDNSYRLYLHRYWNYENNFAKNILSLCKPTKSFIDELKPEQITNISRYFKKTSTEIDWQQVAVYTALVNNFSIITGGPGTGKTTTVAAILALIHDIEPNVSIKICAPTGKAGSRLIEAINNELENLNPINDTTVGKLKSLESFTVHRLLGSLPLSPHFRHNKKNPISADVIIIDEASMIAQTLFAKLLDAVSIDTKIILLGDKDQLASVEAGAVMANLCEVSKPNCFTESFALSLKEYFNQHSWKLPAAFNNQMGNISVELQKSHRFDDTKGIGLLKNAINSNSDKVLEIAKKKTDELELKPLPHKSKINNAVINHIKEVNVVIDNKVLNFNDFRKANTPEEAYKILNEFKILCSHNIGTAGVDNFNRIVHSYFFTEPYHKLPSGTPIMIQENNNQLKLFNGDTGIIWHDSLNKKKAFFPNPLTGIMKPFSIPLLPAFKEVFAMTIHKSQGSGFQNILIILPEVYSPLLTKELIYTAITRAKIYCEVWSNDDIFIKTARHETKRNSGLLEKLTLDQH